MALVNVTNGKLLADDVAKAHCFLTRLKGLLFTRDFHYGQALHIQPCNQIHTLFMKYAIDVLHLNESCEVVGIEENVRPGRVGRKFAGTVSVVELPSGTVNLTHTELGHKLSFFS